MRLENERFCVEIEELGAELTRIYDRKTETDILWEGDPVYWKRHSPVLFPNVGKTYRNTVLINGVQYPTAQHGFARDSEFRCIASGREKASFLLVSTEDTKEVYPFDFELMVTYVLKEDRIQVMWEVKILQMKQCILQSAGIRRSVSRRRMRKNQITCCGSRGKIL